MRVSDFDFHLPPELIAQHPPTQRGDSRMMVIDRATGDIEDRHFRDFPAMLRAGDLLVLNDSRVIPARLFARRAGLRTQSNSPSPSGSIEVLLTQPMGEGRWRALVKPGRKVPVGERLLFDEPSRQEHAPNKISQPLSSAMSTLSVRREAEEPASLLLLPSPLEADVIEAGDYGERTLQFQPTTDFFATLDRIGHIPLPPYIHRTNAEGEDDDRQRYQTVYAGADTHGSAAAPTAGLHFTPAILDAIRSRGVSMAYVTLHVGLGTFQPVRAELLRDIHLHEEHYTLPGSTAEALLEAKREGRRIIAVGTTTTRTLEHIAATEHFHAHSGSTSIFLQPGHRFAMVDALLTNFHLPKSTLLMLVSAFAETPGRGCSGRDKVIRAYRHAVEQRYRFFSFGDCMFLH